MCRHALALATDHMALTSHIEHIKLAETIRNTQIAKLDCRVPRV